MSGIVTRKTKVDKQDFFVVQFEKPFSYRNNEFNKIVIKERHAGSYIGSAREVHVHVCLPKVDLSTVPLTWEDFDHVVWATIKISDKTCL